MSIAITYCSTQETLNNVPYGKYFEYLPYENWSLYNYVLLISENYINVDKKEAHRTFYNILRNINNNLYISQEVRNIALNLLTNKKVSI